MSKNLYSIGEAARAVGVCAETLRLYEKQGEIAPTRLGNGCRVFTADDVQKAREIRAKRRKRRGRRK